MGAAVDKKAPKTAISAYQVGHIGCTALEIHDAVVPKVEKPAPPAKKLRSFDEILKEAAEDKARKASEKGAQKP